MPFPASLKLITLTGDFRDGADDGNPREGVVTITLPTPIRSEGDNVIIPPFELSIDMVDGTFSVELPATTDPEWLPNTATYVIQAVFPDGWRKLWWSFALPYDTAGDTLDLADVGTPNVGTPSLTIRQGTTQPIPDGGYRGVWASGTMYRTGDTVQHSSAMYGALKTSTGVTPGTDATVWKVYSGGGGGGGAVDSVNGQTGDVVLAASDVGAQPVDSDLTAIAALVPTNNDLIQRKSGAWVNRTAAQVKTDLALIASDVGLGNVNNTSDLNKPVSTAQAAADAVVASDAASALAGHEADTTAVHGIADTSVLATQSDVSGRQPLDADLTAIAGLVPSNDDVIQRKLGSWTNRTPAQLKSDLGLVKGDVGLGNVDNTSDANKPVSTATQTALDGKVDESLIDAKGDLIVGTADNTPARLAVGTNGQVLTADSAQTGGVKWADASGGGGDAIVGTYPPQGYGFFAFPGDIGLFDNGTITGSGQITIERLYIPANQELSVLGVLLAANGTYDGSGGANNGMGVYTDAGVLIEAVKPGATVWTTGAGTWKIFTLASPVAGEGSGRFVYVALLVDAYTSGNPNIYYRNVAEVLWRGGNGVSSHRRTFYETGVSDFPASFNPATYGNSGSGYMPLYALG